MRNLNSLLIVVLCLLLCSCGGNADKKKSSEETKKEAKKEKTKKLSKSTKEGMMAVLDDSGIDVPEELQYVGVEKKSTGYTITFTKEEIDEATTTKLNEWFTKQVTELEEAGWKTRTMRDNEEMMGMIFNEIIVYPPEGKKINVSYGLTLGTSFDKEKKLYKFYVNAD